MTRQIRMYSHEIRHSAEYRAWNSMKARCNYPSQIKGLYGKDDVFVCDEWMYDFYQFYKDMGPKPARNYSVERIDNSKGYCKENCRWATAWEQARNKSNNRFYEYKGEKLTLKDWCTKLGLTYKKIHLRITRYDLSFEDAIKDDPFEKLIDIDGKRKNLVSWCRFYNRDYNTVVARIGNGWDKKEAILTPTKNNQNYNLYLTDEKVVEIKKLLKEKIPAVVIAEKYGVTPSAISCIKTGKTWKHIK